MHFLILNEQYESHVSMIISFIFVYQQKPKVWVLQLFDVLFLLWFIILSCSCYDLLLLISLPAVYILLFIARLIWRTVIHVYCSVSGWVQRWRRRKNWFCIPTRMEQWQISWKKPKSKLSYPRMAQGNLGIFPHWKDSAIDLLCVCVCFFFQNRLHTSNGSLSVAGYLKLIAIK